MSNLESEPRTKSSATGNGAGGLTPVEVSAMKDTRRQKRTLFIAGVFALLAMIYVPAPAQQHPFSRAHYRFIFSQDETGIAFFQLLINVAFATIVGALAANIPKRVFAWFQRCFLSKRAVVVYFIAIVIVGLVLAKLADQAERARQEAARVRQAEQANAVARYKQRVAEENEQAEQRIHASPVLKAQIIGPTNPFADLIPQANSLTQDEEKLVLDPIDYQRGQWTTDWGKAFVVAKFFERNLGDRKGELDALADQLGAQKRYRLIEKQKRGGTWWVRVYLYRR